MLFCLSLPPLAASFHAKGPWLKEPQKLRFEIRGCSELPRTEAGLEENLMFSAPSSRVPSWAEESLHSVSQVGPRSRERVQSDLSKSQCTRRASALSHCQQTQTVRSWVGFLKVKEAVHGSPGSLLPGVSGGGIERPRRTCSLE